MSGKKQVILRLAKISSMLYLLIIIHSSALAQSIVNTEKLAAFSQKGISSAIEFNFDFESGNSDIIELNGKALGGFENERHSTKILAGLRYLSEDNKDLVSRSFLHMRYNYFFTKTLRSFTFYQLQRNNSLLLKHRQLFGLGIRKKFNPMDSLKIDIGSGLMYEVEKLDRTDPEIDTNLNHSVYRMANIISIFYYLKPYITLINSLYIQPNTGNFNDIRMLNELSTLFSITNNFKLDISSIWRYDSKPPQSLKKNDISIQIGIVINCQHSFIK